MLMRHLQSEFHWIYSSKPEVSNGTAYVDWGKHIIRVNLAITRGSETCIYVSISTVNHQEYFDQLHMSGITLKLNGS